MFTKQNVKAKNLPLFQVRKNVLRIENVKTEIALKKRLLMEENVLKVLLINMIQQTMSI